MKLAMLAHAFEGGALRVEIRTDGRNDRSQAAIAKLGAVREGVLRRQKRLWNGDIRDTVVFSILKEEWPQVRQRLDAGSAGFSVLSLSVRPVSRGWNGHPSVCHPGQPEVDFIRDLGAAARPYASDRPKRRARKKRLRSVAPSSASTPPVTCGRQWQVGWAKKAAPCSTAPPFGSLAP